jgi:DNA polymerase (family 10)
MMELHGENEFRIRAYRNAYDVLKKLDQPASEMPTDELTKLKGIGASTGEKIRELIDKGQMDRFEQYAKKTPEGIRDMLMVKGLGPGKVKAVWKGLGVESPGELLYACHENRLVELSGFGMKTQAEIRRQLEYHLESKGKYLWAALEPVAETILTSLQSKINRRVEWVGEYARKCAIVEHFEGIVVNGEDLVRNIAATGVEVEETDGVFKCVAAEVYRFTLIPVPSEDFDNAYLSHIADSAFRTQVEAAGGFTAAMRELPPELMEGKDNAERARQGGFHNLVTEEDMIGIIHCHSTYSDGLHTLREMAEYTRDAGYSYLGITDHSQSAVYARGLSPDRVAEQWAEIETLNAELAPFRIFRGIESDIRADGSLDYDDDLLALFDFIIASVHSGLRMDEAKATSRLIKAIENPYTRILGHPTGRLLLAREGYPIDHRKVIDACARNAVVIELNANPQRLDMDSSYIPYALEQGVMISINPDAHSRESIGNARYGVSAARRGGLTADMCLNHLSQEAFIQWLEEKEGGGGG